MTKSVEEDRILEYLRRHKANGLADDAFVLAATASSELGMQMEVFVEHAKRLAAAGSIELEITPIDGTAPYVGRMCLK